MGHGSATTAMLRHRYGETPSAPPDSIPEASSDKIMSIAESMRGKPMTPRQNAVYRAGLQFVQNLQANGITVPVIIVPGLSSFAFKSPLNQVARELGPIALETAANHNTSVTIMVVFIRDYPTTLLIFTDNPVQARLSLQRHYTQAKTR